jgi:F-type H+-transporting ATPase subunit a
MGNVGVVFRIMIGGTKIVVTYSVLFQWIIMALIMITAWALTRRLETVPRGKQAWAEIIVENINNLVRDNMGPEFMGFVPYIGTIAIYILLLNLFTLTGIHPPTSDYSVTVGLALMSFVIIHATSISRNGLGHYLKGYTHPYAFMLPLTLIERLVVPVSLSLRLFGNMTTGVIIMDLIYSGLEGLSKTLHTGIPIFATIIPLPFHIYFDIFDGAIQMFIFIMLTMLLTKTTSEE